MEARVANPRAQAQKMMNNVINANKKAQELLDVKKAQANDLPDKEEVERKTETVERKTEEKKPVITKKSVIIELISTKKGATVDQCAQAIVDRAIDPDLEKNKRVVKLWLSKIGFKVEKLDNGYYRKA